MKVVLLAGSLDDRAVQWREKQPAQRTGAQSDDQTAPRDGGVTAGLLVDSTDPGKAEKSVGTTALSLEEGTVLARALTWGRIQDVPMADLTAGFEGATRALMLAGT